MIRGLFILLVVAILLGGGYFVYTKVSDSRFPQPDQTIQISPDKTVEEFYKWYLEFKGQALTSGAYKGSPLLTKNFVTILDDKSSGYKNLLYDPILCAQDKPKDSHVEKVTIDENGKIANVIYYENYYGTDVRSNVSLVQESGHWYIDNIECILPQEPDKNLERQVIIYFFNYGRDPSRRGKDPGYRGVYGVARALDDGEERYKGTMTRLFEGPTGPELAQGFSSMLVARMYRNIFVLGNTAYVDFNDSIKDEFTNITTDIAAARQQIEETLKHNKEITNVIYAINNDPTDFYNWSGIGCPPEGSEQNYCSKRPFNEFGNDPNEDNTTVDNTSEMDDVNRTPGSENSGGGGPLEN